MGNWDGVPWMIGGGAQHSTNVARNVSHAAFGGLPGIVSPTDCEVRELATPGAQVRVYPGTVAIKNEATGTRDEMYVGRLPIEDTIDIAATDSTGGRSDLIIARVENPFEAGEPWSDPADPKVGPYIFTRIISNVSSTSVGEEIAANGYSAIALARIDIPASTGTITQSMITDLRHLAREESKRYFNVIAPSAKNPLTGANYHNWPSEANMPVDVPDWATHCKVRAIIGGVVMGGTGNNGGSGWNVFGETRIQFGGGSADTYSQGTAWNVSNEGGHDRFLIMAGAPMLPIDPANRGKTATLRIESELRSATAGAEVYVNAGSMLSLDVEFVNAAESNG